MLAIPAAGAAGWALRGVASEGAATEARDPGALARGADLRDATPDVAPPALPAHIRALVIGGGPHPSANEVQLEDDLGLAVEVLGPEGTVVLFAGGPGTRAVRVEDGSAPPATLRDTLAALFSTGSSRGSTFRPTDLEVHGAATLGASLELLSLARADASAQPLLFFFAGHGDGGEAPEDASALFWGGEALDPMTFADELDAALGPVGDDDGDGDHDRDRDEDGDPDDDENENDGSDDRADEHAEHEARDDGEAGVGARLTDEAGDPPPAPAVRRLRIVMTSCFAGGFADIVFSGADPARGVTPDDRCGLFATAWDLEASGCDADPDRARHEGYGVHFLHALAGRARDRSDARSSIDLNGDGTVTLSEAHAHARITSRSLDVPTSTSARLVRELGHGLAAQDAPPIAWREEEAVRRALGEALDVSGRAEAEARESDAQARAVELDARREELGEVEEGAWLEVTSALLSRWPVLDDPWHPDFEPMLDADGAAIGRALTASAAYAEWQDATTALGALDADADALAAELALIRRYLEADDTLTWAARIAAARPEDWQAVLRVRACEESAP